MLTSASDIRLRSTQSTPFTAARVHERIRLLLMRHSGRHLTDHYGDAEHHWSGMREAVESLPALTYRSPEDRLQERERIKADIEAMGSYGISFYNASPDDERFLNLPNAIQYSKLSGTQFIEQEYTFLS